MIGVKFNFLGENNLQMIIVCSLSFMLGFIQWRDVLVLVIRRLMGVQTVLVWFFYRLFFLNRVQLVYIFFLRGSSKKGRRYFSWGWIIEKEYYFFQFIFNVFIYIVEGFIIFFRAAVYCYFLLSLLLNKLFKVFFYGLLLSYFFFFMNFFRWFFGFK